jgi:hypothetical protein
MAIIAARPPNFDQILAAFPHAAGTGVIFAHGDHIYSPGGEPIPLPLLAHEHVHLDEQKKCASPEAWWDLYIADHEFRYRQELLAHVAEYKAQLAGLDRNAAAKRLMSTASRLVAPLYNYTPPRSMTRAMFDIKRELG